MRRSGALLWLSVCLLTASPRGSFAAYIDLTGVPGADGAAGAAGNPGQGGGSGGSGETLDIDFPTADFDNSATITGGAGGAGGAGGEGVPAGAAGGDGGGGGTGGAATVRGSTTGPDGYYQAAIATGGVGGAGGAGGAATAGGLPGLAGAGGTGGAAAADARITGVDGVNAQALAYGGAGGASSFAGGRGGAATAHAEGYADSGTASVFASQTGGAGGSSDAAPAPGQDSFVENQVAGDTPDYLELNQYAEGGAGGTGPGSRGGNARSVLTRERDHGNYGLRLFSNAQGGAASSPDGSAGLAARGGDADIVVEGRDHLGRTLELYGLATGGNATGPNSQTGTPTVSVHGVSTAGGTIYAAAQAIGGNGTTGGSVELVDTVTGETSGELSIGQDAAGGFGTERVGSASSRLQRSGSFAALEVRTSASAGGAFEDQQAAPGATTDAFGFAESMANNVSGSAYAEAKGTGGYAGTYPFPTSADGGDGEAHASATSEGDGHAAGSRADAYGGSLYSDGQHRGGDALATATSIALGDSEASSYAGALSGGADSGDLLRSGRSRAESTASSAGSAAVSADAFASINVDYEPPAHDLLASEARSIATGNGEVTSHALARGSIDSIAHATSHSTGHVIGADAQVTQFAHRDPLTPYTALGAQASFRATYSEGIADFYTGEGFDSLGYMNALPDHGNAQDWTADNSLVAGMVASDELLAMGLVRAGDGVSADFSLTIDTGVLGPGDFLQIGFVDLVLPASGFESLHIELVLDGNLFADLDFTDPALALASLSDNALGVSLASAPDHPVSLDIRYLIDVLPNTPLGQLAFESRFIVFAQHVPEPALAVLLGAALIAVVCLRGRVSRTTR